MFASLLSSFFGSPQHQQALQALQAQGIDASQAQPLMEAAVHGAAKGMHAQTEGQEPALGLFNIFGGHAGREFLTGAITGILRGDGIGGSLKDGFYGAIGGHVAEVIAQRTGMDQTAAGEIAAVATPFIVHFAHEKLAAHPSVTAVHGAKPF